MQREKIEQAHTVQLLRSLGANVYVLGTRRRKGEHQGTMQTPGLSDLIAFVPLTAAAATTFNYTRGQARALLFIECKAKGGRLSAEQEAFRIMCLAAGAEHVVGNLDAVIAWCIAHEYLKADNVAHYRRPPNATT